MYILSPNLLYDTCTERERERERGERDDVVVCALVGREANIVRNWNNIKKCVLFSVFGLFY
jgi:hypothetical protein